MDVTGTNNEKVEYKVDKEYINRIETYAKEHGFVINEYAKKKIEWMRTHSGHCFCSPIERTCCPCDNVYEDMKRFSGRCLCRLFWKPDAYDKWMKNKQKQRTLSDVKTKSSLKKTKEEKLKEKEIIQNVWKSLQ